MKISPRKSKKIVIAGDEINFRRNDQGVMTISAPSFLAYVKGLGFSHACDRFVQMDLMRVVANGQLCELVQDSDENLAIDILMRELGISHYVAREAQSIDPSTEGFINSYIAGINHHLETYGRPWTHLLMGRRPQHWQLTDTLGIIKLMGYIGLGQTQQDAQKFLISSLAQGVEPSYLKSLFSPHLDELTQQQLESIRKLKLFPCFFADEKQKEALQQIQQKGLFPCFKNSNNWVINSTRSKSNSPIMAADPHLEVNRLPAVWYEVVATTPDNTYMGITLPGVPGLIMGRNQDISFSFTYGFMDMIDYFVEKIEDQKYCDHNGQTHSFQIRREVIKRKRSSDKIIFVRENERGTLEAPMLDANCDEGQSPPALEDGHYLSRSWSCYRQGALKSLRAIEKLHHARNALIAKEVVKPVDLSCNWLLADRQNNIVYQQSGNLPQRLSGGLIAHLPFQYPCNWQSHESPDMLHSIINPQEGVLFSANNSLNRDPQRLAVNLPMADYRVRRIEMLLKGQEKFDLEDMQNIQKDLYSLQARDFIEKMGDIFHKSGQIIDFYKWDLKYDKDAKGPDFFERFYKNLVIEVFAPIFTEKQLPFITTPSALFADYFGLFDRILLEHEFSGQEQKLWYPPDKNRERESLYQKAFFKTRDQLEQKPLRSWGQVSNIVMRHIIYGKGWLKIFRANHGPIPIEGSRATIVQGNIYCTPLGASSFCPSWRYLADLSENSIHTALAGGVRENPGPFFKSDISRWQSYEYKKMQPQQR